MLGERFSTTCHFAQMLLAALAASIVVLCGHQDAAGREVIMRTGKIANHKIALRIWQHEHEIEQAMRLAFDAMTGGIEFDSTRLPGLLTGQTTGEMFQCGMRLRTQKQDAAFGADGGINIKGVDESVEGVGHEKKS